MDVTLIAYTEIQPALFKTPFTEHPSQMHGADVLAEFAGRACYESWSRPNPATEKNFDYLGNILAQQHFSVLEHASATFYVTGVSRSLTHELVRHRHLSFSQLSQRYVDESNVDFIMPPALKDNTQIREESNVDEFVFDARLLYTNLVRVFLKQGLSRKEAREAARCVLPNMTETRIVVTGNHRTWREVIAKRAHPAADAEIQELARELLRQLKLIAPATYQDM